MKKLLMWVLVYTTVAFGSFVQAQTAAPGKVMRIETRPGVTVPIFALWQNNAVATLVLFSGSDGGFGKIGSDGWPSSNNFLIRTGALWTAHPFNVVMVGRPSDGIDLGDGAVRIGAQHAADNLAIYKAVKQHSPLPIWVVGTSMGTISAAASAIQDKDNLISGLVLTSSVTSRKRTGALPTQDLAKIHVPTLIVHHEKDACKICLPYEVVHIANGLANVPIKKTVMVNGGSGAKGDPCHAEHYHGFIGMEKQVVDLIAAWIVHPTI